MDITVLVLTQNSEATLERTLKSLTPFGSVIVVDGGSKDKTQEICRAHGAEFISNPFKGFSDQRNFALSKCESEWAFFVDSDEEVTEELADHLNSITGGELYGVYRTEYFNGLEIKEGFGGNCYQQRFFRADLFHYVGKVHEHPVRVDGKPFETLFIDKKYRLHHNPNNDLELMVKKLGSYSTLMAKDKISRGRKTPLLTVFFAFNWYSIKYCIKNRKSGHRGFILAFLEGVNKALIYLYLYENKNKSGEVS